MSQWVAKALRPRESSPRWLIARWLFIPFNISIGAATVTYMFAMQEGRHHDLDIRKSYRRIQEFYPYTHDKQWARWCKQDVDQKHWWRIMIRPSYTEKQFYPPHELERLEKEFRLVPF